MDTYQDTSTGTETNPTMLEKEKYVNVLGDKLVELLAVASPELQEEVRGLMEEKMETWAEPMHEPKVITLSMLTKNPWGELRPYLTIMDSGRMWEEAGMPELTFQEVLKRLKEAKSVLELCEATGLSN